MAKIKNNESTMTVQELIRKSSDIPRSLIPVFHKLRKEAFSTAQQVFDDRAVGYNIDHPPYEEQVYGVISLASEVYKRSRRITAILSPLRMELLRKSDINRAMDICIDTINYLTWTYAVLKMASGFEGNADSDDAPDYSGKDKEPVENEHI